MSGRRSTRRKRAPTRRRNWRSPIRDIDCVPKVTGNGRHPGYKRRSRTAAGEGTMSDYWNQSAGAWIADQGERGDFSRAFVLDKVMLERIEGRGFAAALDVGCG